MAYGLRSHSKQFVFHVGGKTFVTVLFSILVKYTLGRALCSDGSKGSWYSTQGSDSEVLWWRCAFSSSSYVPPFPFSPQIIAKNQYVTNKQNRQVVGEEWAGWWKTQLLIQWEFLSIWILGFLPRIFFFKLFSSDTCY